MNSGGETLQNPKSHDFGYDSVFNHGVKWPALIVWVLLAGLGLGQPAAADDSRPLYVEIAEIEPGTYRIGLRVPPSIPPFNQPSLVLPRGCIERTGAGIETSSTPRFDRGIAYRIYDCDESLSGQTLEIRYPLAHPAVATVVRMTFPQGRSHTIVLAPGERHLQVPETETRSSVARDYLRLGIHHIWAGTDHLLFLVCLIFIAGSFGRILTTITGFTLAHSLTLALSALEVVRLPVPPIEAAIALSVVFLATEVTKGRRDNLTWRYPITVSSAFGLLHGLGFAAVLNEIGLPNTELVTGLLFFNVGVEIGQVLFATLVVIGMPLLRRVVWSRGSDDRLWQRLQTIMGYGVGCLAAFWLFQRVASFDLTRI